MALRRRKTLLDKKVAVKTFLDPETYMKVLFLSKKLHLPISRLVARATREGITIIASHAGDPGSNPGCRACSEELKNAFRQWISQQNLSPRWEKEILRNLEKTALFSNHFTGKNLKTLLWNAINKKPNNNYVKALRKFIKFCVEKGYLLEFEAFNFLKELKTKPTNPDNKVPSDEEIKYVIVRLKRKWLLSYLILLTSGIRIVELDLIPKNLDKVDVFENFARIGILKVRNTKRVEYVYVPIWLWNYIEKRIITSSTSLQLYLRRRVLLPAKYTRKWFYTKALDLGIPVEIADFYQGRIPQRIGLRHYYNALHRADELYGKVLVPYFREFLEGIAKDKKEVDELLRQKPLKG